VTAAPAAARTWRVAKDGSGDFAVIQAAVDAAAPGDTVSIGPGRFLEKAPYTTPGWTKDVYVVATKDSLTFIGSGQDVTIIGPATRLHTPPAHPKGFAILFVSSARVECHASAVAPQFKISQVHAFSNCR
jgi:pectin methylesterase-like acyl-CoA thioesterase